MANSPDNITVRRRPKTSNTMEASPSQATVTKESYNEINNTVLDLKSLVTKLNDRLIAAEDQITILQLQNESLKKELAQFSDSIAHLNSKKNTEDGAIPHRAMKSNNVLDYKDQQPRVVNVSEQLSLNISNRQCDGEQVQVLSRTTSLDKQGDNVFNNADCNVSNNLNNKKKVVIIGDQQGWKIQETLQKLLGPSYQVSCFWKPGATTSEILKTDKLQINTLTQNDTVVVMCGINDTNPFAYQSSVTAWLNSNTHTNIIMCEIPYNNTLYECKLNYELRHICNQFKTVSFLDLNHSRRILKGFGFALNLCKLLLREILRISYSVSYNVYVSQCIKSVSMQCRKKIIKTVDSYTQTDVIISDSNINDYENNLFRAP